MRKRGIENLITGEEVRYMVGWSWGSTIGFWNRSLKLRQIIARVTYYGRERSSFFTYSRDRFLPSNKKELGEFY
jgi:hypothetical protein